MSQTKSKNTEKSNKPKRRLFIFRRSLALILTTIVLVACIVASMLFTDMKAMIDNRPELDINQLKTSESSRIFDANGELVAEIGYKLSDNVSFEEMPSSLIDAFIAVEDSRFFEHDGFDIARFVSAIINNIRSGDLFNTGASTITMQVVKNAYFVTEESLAENSVDRKVQEISMAVDVEKELDKKTIFELYVNKINFGAPESLGVAKAAEFYFGKEVSDLTLSESAYLAGVINAPGALNAFKNLAGATNRRNEVLNLMQRHGYISAQENALAQSIRLEDQLVDNNLYRGSDYIYPSYIDTVINEVIELTNVSPFNVGMDIYTALQPSQQQAIEAIQNGEVVEFADDVIQSGIVTLNNQTGEIIAIGGGRPGVDKIQRGLNRATSTYRQPGSSVKPILSYALAFEDLGWSTQHIIEDGPYAYAGGNFVYNYSTRFSGDVTLTDAVIRSLNIPAIKTLEEVTRQTSYGYVIQYLKNLGFDENVADNYSLGYAIGSANFQVTPVQLAAAHGTIINAGNYIKPHTVNRIEIDGNDPIIPTYAETSVISPQAAYLASYTMAEAVNAPLSGGATAAARLKQGYPVYAKTGTTDHDDSFTNLGIPDGAGKDSWMVASTSQYTLASWYGYDTATDGNYIRSVPNASRLNADLANYLLDSLEQLYTPVAIERPGGISNITHIKGVYPYARPIEGMDGSLLVTDMVKSEFAGLTDYTPPLLEDLATQNVETGKLLLLGLKVNVTMTPYPNAEQLVVAEPTKEMEATNKNGRVLKATGTRAFDPSWIFGPVRYGTDIKVDGKVIATVVNEENAREMIIPNIRANQNLEVCSYYRWEKNDTIRSNEVCQVINSGEQSLTFPNFQGLPVSEFEAWIKANTSAAYQITQNSSAKRPEQVGLIAKVSPDYSSQPEIELSKINGSSYQVEVNDLKLSSNDIIGKTVNQVNQKYPNFFEFSGATSPDARITSANVPSGEFYVSSLQRSGSKFAITVTTEAPNS